ncbi:MAG: hypothetical protein RBJ76_13115 [Stenomitos frigidus ULC029]
MVRLKPHLKYTGQKYCIYWSDYHSCFYQKMTSLGFVYYRQATAKEWLQYQCLEGILFYRKMKAMAQAILGFNK